MFSGSPVHATVAPRNSPLPLPLRLPSRRVLGPARLHRSGRIPSAAQHPRDQEMQRPRDPTSVALRAEPIGAEPMVGGRRQDRSLKYRSGSNGLQSTDPPSTGKSLGPHHEPRSRTAKQPLLVRRKLTHSSSAPEEDFEVFFFLRSLQLTYPFDSPIFSRSLGIKDSALHVRQK